MNYIFTKTTNQTKTLSSLPTPYSLLPTPYSLLPTPYSLLPTKVRHSTIQQRHLFWGVDV